MKRIALVLVILLNTFLPTLAFASDVSQPVITPEILGDVKVGKKVDVQETINTNSIKSSDDRFVVFVKEKKYEQEKRAVADLGGVYSFEDDATYGKVKAVPVDLSYMNLNEKETFINEMNSRSSVVAISKVQTRTLSAVPSFDDPRYPTDLTYSSSKQWYLSQPSGGNYGIDALRAWQTLDTEGIEYGGDSDVIVAVLDTGAAYETYNKYDDFSEMTSPQPWVFTQASDFTSNIFVNYSDTANNQINDDANSDIDFCLDTNQDGDCDTTEPAGFIDDRNGVNIVDWGKYWSRVTYSELTSAPVCSDEPYLSNGVKCVSDISLDSVCTQDGLSNDQYHGCFESDMGHPNDTNGHGTLVSNIISAQPNNGISGVGVASGVQILPVKIFGENYDNSHSKWIYDSAYGDQIAAAINYAVNAGAKIINMSFAGSSIDLYEKMAMDRAYYENDVLLIASSGNSASSSTMYPAGYDSVLSVGASTKTGGRASYSSYGSNLDLVAPVDTGIVTQGISGLTSQCSWNSSLSCMSIDPEVTAFNNVADLTVSGTSFATPQVVGVAALVMSRYPELTATQVAYLLKMSTLPNGSATSTTSLGHGILNAYNAVNAKDYKGTVLTSMRRMYQSYISTNGNIQTRFSDVFGAKWSPWIQSGTDKSVGMYRTINLPTNAQRVIQIMKGTNSSVNMRYADDYGFQANDDSQWSNWIVLGFTSGGISTVKTSNNLVITWRGTDGKVYTKYTTDGQNWILAPTSTTTVTGSVSMVVNPATDKIVQTIRSTGNYLYTRTSTDFGHTWSAWTQSYDVALADPMVTVVGNRIIRTVRIKDNVIITRHSDDGGTTWSSRNRTTGASGLAVSTVSITETSTNNLIQTYRTASGDIYTRKSTDNGSTWSTQIIGTDFKSGIKAVSNPAVAAMGTNVIQMVKASDGYLYYRRSTNAGSSWGGWRNSGSIKVLGNVSMSYESGIGRLYINAQESGGKIYSRYSDDQGASYSAWVVGSNSISGISSFSTITSQLDLTNSPS